MLWEVLRSGCSTPLTSHIRKLSDLCVGLKLCFHQCTLESCWLCCSVCSLIMPCRPERAKVPYHRGGDVYFHGQVGASLSKTLQEMQLEKENSFLQQQLVSPSCKGEFQQERETRQSQEESHGHLCKRHRWKLWCYWPCDWEFASTNCLQSLGSACTHRPRSLMSCSQRKWGINPQLGRAAPSFLVGSFLPPSAGNVCHFQFSQANSNLLLFTFDCFVLNVAYKDFMCFCFISVILLLLWQSASIFFRSGNCIFIVSCSQRDKLPCISHRH